MLAIWYSEWLENRLSGARYLLEPIIPLTLSMFVELHSRLSVTVP